MINNNCVRDLKSIKKSKKPRIIDILKRLLLKIEGDVLLILICMDKWLLAFTTLSFLLQLSFITQCKMDFIRILLKQILSLQQNIIIRLSHTNTKFLSTIYKYLKTKQNTEIFIEKIKIYTFFLNESQTYDNGVQTVHLPHKFITIYNNIQCEKLFRITSSTEDL